MFFSKTSSNKNWLVVFFWRYTFQSWCQTWIKTLSLGVSKMQRLFLSLSVWIITFMSRFKRPLWNGLWFVFSHCSGLHIITPFLKETYLIKWNILQVQLSFSSIFLLVQTDSTFFLFFFSFAREIKCRLKTPLSILYF